MEKIRLDDMEVLAGLEWTALSTDVPEKKAMSDFLAENKKSSKGKINKGVIVRYGGITVVGRQSDIGKMPKCPSALALLAFANQKAIDDMGGISSGATTSEEQNWIVVEKVQGEEDKYWMGAVKNGVPVPGSDMVDTQHKIIEDLVDFINASSNFTVFTTDADVRYNVISQVNVIDRSYADIIRGIPTKNAYPKLFSIGAIVALAVVITAIVLMAGWFGYSQWAESKRLETQRRLAAEQQQKQAAEIEKEKQEYEAQLRDTILKELKGGMDDISASISTPRPYLVADAWRSILYNIDLYQSGWNIERIDCALETKTTPICTVSLLRGNLGVNKNLMQENPDAVIEGDKASYVVRLPNLQERSAQFSYVAPANNFSVGLLSDLQSIRSTGVEHTVTGSKDIVKNVTLPPSPSIIPSDPSAPADKANSISIELGFAQGSITVKGRELWQIMGVAKYLDHPSVILKDISIMQSSDSLDSSNWTMTMDYLVRTLPQPIIPAVPLGDTKIVIEIPEEYRGNVVTEGGIADSSVSSTAEDPLSDTLFEEDTLAPPEPF